MVAVVQLVEPQVVILVVAGSSPVSHPIKRLIALSHAIIVAVSRKLEVPETRNCNQCGNDFDTVWSVRKCGPCRELNRTLPACSKCGKRLTNGRYKTCGDCVRDTFYVPKEFTVDELMWVAGLLEGEGSFTRNGYRRRVVCTSTDYDVLVKLKNVTGVGAICKTSKRESHHKQAWLWTAGKKVHAVHLATTLYPLMSKRRKLQIENMLHPYNVLSAEDDVYFNDAWLSGLFEGEGCLGIYHHRQGDMNIEMTDFDTISRVVEVSGFGTVRHIPPKQERWKPTYKWRVSKSSDVDKLCRRMLPYMGERRRGKMLKFLDTRS